MATVPETQAFINEMAEPSLHSDEQNNTWLKASAKFVRLESQQIALVRGLLQEVEIVDVSDLPTEGLMQQVNAQRRIVGIIAENLRDMRGSQRILADQFAELCALAKNAGYTIP